MHESSTRRPEPEEADIMQHPVPKLTQASSSASLASLIPPLLKHPRGYLAECWALAIDRLRERAPKARLALAFAAAAAVSFGLLPGASKELAALPAGTAVAMSRAVLTLVDGKLLDILAADAPAEVVMGTGKAVAIESVITQHGRANPTDVRVVLESEASAGAIITPQTTTLIESALASNEERDLATSFNIDCTAAGTHTFSVTARIEPLNGAHTDPDLSNNQRSVSFEVTCLPCLHASQSLDLGDGTQITVAQALSGNYFGLGTGGATATSSYVPRPPSKVT
jgi:hypothetical protein